MTIDSILTLLVAVLVPFIGGVFHFVNRRISFLEKHMISAKEARQLIDDKLNPIADDMKEVKRDIHELVQILLKLSGYNEKK